jgi:hypothetical protein
MGDQNAGTLSIRVKGYPNPIEFGDWTHDRLFHTVEFQGLDTQELQAFVGGVGSPIPGGSRALTAADTNIPRSGDNGVPKGWEMLIYSIQISVVREMIGITGAAFSIQDQTTAPAQRSRPVHVGGYDPAVTNGGVLFDFMRKTFHQFQYNQKVQSEGTVDKYPQGSGPTVFTTGTSVEVASNGMASPRDQSAFVLPIWLRPEISYVSKLRPVTGLGIQPGNTAGLVQGYTDWSGGELAAAIAGFDVKVTLEGLLRRPVA